MGSDCVGLNKSIRNVGLSSCSTSSMAPMPWISCKLGEAVRRSGLRAGADMSTEEAKLPAVLPDMADVIGLTVA